MSEQPDTNQPHIAEDVGFRAVGDGFVGPLREERRDAQIDLDLISALKAYLETPSIERQRALARVVDELEVLP